jgi:hypothetical protein
LCGMFENQATLCLRASWQRVAQSVLMRSSWLVTLRLWKTWFWTQAWPSYWCHSPIAPDELWAFYHELLDGWHGENIGWIAWDAKNSRGEH